MPLEGGTTAMNWTQWSAMTLTPTHGNMLLLLRERYENRYSGPMKLHLGYFILCISSYNRILRSGIIPGGIIQRVNQ